MENGLTKLAEKFAEIFILKIEQIENNCATPWLKKNTLIPQNIRGTVYEGVNRIMLQMITEVKEYSVPVFLTFNQCKELNVKINRGSKSFPVYFYKFTIKHITEDLYITFEEYNNLSDEEKELYTLNSFLHMYNVFNVDQTTFADKYPERIKGYSFMNASVKCEETYKNEMLDNMLETQMWICPIRLGSNRAFYRLNEDKIFVPAKDQYKDTTFFYTVLLHEMAHSTGSIDRLNRIFFQDQTKENYAREELIAELTAAVTSTAYNITSTIREDNLSYLKSWLNAIKKEPQYIFSVMKDVNKSVDYIHKELSKSNIEIKETA